MMSQGYTQTKFRMLEILQRHLIEFLRSVNGVTKKKCYRLRDIPTQSVCEPWLDPDSNKTNCKETFLEKPEKLNTSMLDAVMALLWILLGMMKVFWMSLSVRVVVQLGVISPPSGQFGNSWRHFWLSWLEVLLASDGKRLEMSAFQYTRQPPTAEQCSLSHVTSATVEKPRVRDIYRSNYEWNDPLSGVCF